MHNPLATLTAEELLAIALEASRRGDTSQAVTCLKEACDRPEATASAFFMLGSEYAQLGMVPEAKAAMARAASISPSFLLPHFQLGMLHLTSGEVDEARAAWSPLADIAEPHPQAYLATLRRGMLHLIDDEFDAALLLLGRGVAQNAENEPLNADMRRVIDAIEHLPGRHAPQASMDSGPRQPAAPPRPPPDITSPSGDEAEVDAGHLFISAYTQSGKPH